MAYSRSASFEKIPLGPGESFAFREFDLPAFETPWHFHPEIELTLVLESTGRRFVGDDIEDFAPGDLVLVGANLPHLWHNPPGQEGAGRARSLVVQFRREFLGEAFLEVPELAGVRDLLDRAGRGIRFGGECRDRVELLIRGLGESEGMGRLLGLLEILKVLGESEDGRLLASPGFHPRIDSRTGDRVARICEFVLRDPGGDITLASASAVVHMSPSAFSRYFKKVMGKTFSRFVNEIRVGSACRALIETERSIAEIAFDSGFNTLSNFNRRFQELRGMTPREFRTLRPG